MSYKFGIYNFLFPEELSDPWLTLSCMGIEQRGSKDYYFDNRYRTEADEYLFQYTLKGAGVFESEGIRHRMTEGRAFFVHLPDNEKYYMPENNPDNPWEFIFLLFRGEHVRKYYELITNKAGKVLDLPLKHNAVQTLFELYNRTRYGRMLHPFLGSESAYRFLCQLCQTVMHSKENYSKRTEAAIKIMETRYHELEGVIEIAETLGISTNHFSREFRRETGIPPIRFLTNIRLRQSARMLQETSLPIREIAALCGFTSGNYYTKIFRKYMNVTPNDFRNEWGQH